MEHTQIGIDKIRFGGFCIEYWDIAYFRGAEPS